MTRYQTETGLLRKLFSLPLSLLILCFLLVVTISSCARKKGAEPILGDKELWVSLEVSVSEPGLRASSVWPTQSADGEDKGTGKESDIASVRVLLFQEDGSLANNIASPVVAPVVRGTADSEKHNAIVRFKIGRAAPANYRLVLVANEGQLNSAARSTLAAFSGTYEDFKLLELGTVSLSQMVVGDAFLPMIGESDLFSIYRQPVVTADGIDYIEISNETNPIKMTRILSRVDFVLTNTEDPTVPLERATLVPESENIRFKSMVRMNVRDEAFLCAPATARLMPSKAYTSEQVTGKSEHSFGEKFVFSEKFYAGPYENGTGFEEQNKETRPSDISSAVYLITLQDLNGTNFEYLVPIGQIVSSRSNQVRMLANTIYRIKATIRGRKLSVALSFRVAKEEEETLDPIFIYPKNPTPLNP